MKFLEVLGFFLKGSEFFAETEELDLAALLCSSSQFLYSLCGYDGLYCLDDLASPDAP